MNMGTSRLAGNVGVGLNVIRWLLIMMLALLVPAAIIGFLLPNGLSIAGIMERVDAPMRARGAYSIGPILAYACANLALTLVIVSKLHRMMITVATGQPFDPANILRLRRIAAAMAGLALLATFVRPLIPTPSYPAMTLATPDLNLGLWLSAAVVFVLSEVFREGTRLREDADMTV